jgi:hypothetical protein
MNPTGLREYRDRLDTEKEAFFRDWPISAEVREACRQNLAATVDALIGLGPDAPAAAVSDVLGRCVERYNDLDNGFIGTIEREELADILYEVGRLAGMDDEDDWLEEWREW